MWYTADPVRDFWRCRGMICVENCGLHMLLRGACRWQHTAGDHFIYFFPPLSSSNGSFMKHSYAGSPFTVLCCTGDIAIIVFVRCGYRLWKCWRVITETVDNPNLSRSVSPNFCFPSLHLSFFWFRTPLSAGPFDATRLRFISFLRRSRRIPAAIAARRGAHVASFHMTPVWYGGSCI